MTQNLAALRAKVEFDLRGRASTPFDYRSHNLVETVSIGIPEIDYLAGGLPRGGLTEICGPPGSGRTRFLFAALALRTANAEACVLVDGSDNFDPHSAEVAGVHLKQLLWVRCRNIEQALRATDLLLQGRGFGLIAMDLSGIAAETVRHVPLNAWFRFRRAVEDTPTILFVLEQESNAKTCASLVLRLEAGTVRWSTTQENQAGDSPVSSAHPLAWLLDGFDVHTEVLRSRIQPLAAAVNFHNGSAAACMSTDAGMFESKAIRNDPYNLLIESKLKNLKRRE